MYSIPLSRRICVHIVSWYSELRSVSQSTLFEGKKITIRTLDSVLRIARAITRLKQKKTLTETEFKAALDFVDIICGGKEYGSSGVVEESVTSQKKHTELDKDFQGMCPYCGKANAWIRWKDEAGNYLCQGCHEQEMLITQEKPEPSPEPK